MLSNERHLARFRPRPLSQTRGDKEERGRCRIKSSPRLCKSTVVSVFFLLMTMWLPQFGSAHRPRGLREQQQHQQFQRITTEESEEYEDIQPTSCIETASELLNAIRDFYHLRESFEYDSSAAQTYGWPIEGWCVSSEVEQKLKSGDESPLTQDVVTAIENIVDTHDDDSFSLPDPNILITHWILSGSGSPCVDVCSDANDTTAFSTTTASPSPIGETVVNQNTEEDDQNQT